MSQQKQGFFDYEIFDFRLVVMRLFGAGYIAKNNFSHSQKINILNYLYLKNQMDMSKPKRKFYNEIEAKESVQYMEEDLKKLEQIEEYNRIFVISNSLHCYSRIKIVGNLKNALD